MIKNWKLIL